MMLRIDNKRNYKISGILIVAMLLSGFGCSDNTAQLASYDGGVVNQAEFLNHYQKYLKITGIPDNLPDRNKILRSALHEELILKDWHIKNMDEDPVAQELLNRQAEQAILDAWWAEISTTEREPTPEALAQMLIKEKSRFHLHESHHSDLKSALLTYERWQLEPIEGIKDLGFISLEDIHPRLMATINALDIGELSHPVRLGDGYSIIKLIEKKAPLFIRPREFATARQRLSQEWQVIRSDSIANAYTKTVLAGLNVQFNENGCTALFDMVKQTPKDELQNSLAESNQASISVCNSINGDWTIAMLTPHLQDSKVEHLNAVVDVRDLQKLISGILVRRSLITEAMHAGVHRKEQTQTAIQKRQDLWRIKTWQTSFADTVTISQNYLAQIDQTDASIGADILYRNVEFLVFQDSVTALEAYAKLIRGIPTAKITDNGVTYSELPNDGQMGWVSAEELGQAADPIFGQELNTWTKPWNYSDKLFLFRSMAEKQEHLDINVTYKQLEAQIRSQGAPVQLEKTLLAMEKDNHVKIYEERIKEIPYIQLSGPVNES